MISQQDRRTVRYLAAQWRELASLPVMDDRKRLWKAVHDLKPRRPVILFETAWIEDYVAEHELLCEDPFVYEFNVGEFGDLGFIGNFFFGLTWQVYRFIGNPGLLYWVYDAPDAIHRLMEYMLDDRVRLFEYLQAQGLLALNTDSQMAGPRSYGYVSDLPAPDSPRQPTVKDLWGWAESQESESMSPAMYQEFFLPYLARLSQKFGVVAFSRKPTRAYLSGPSPNWDLLEKDMRRTYSAARDCNVELLFRDVYTISGDRARLRRWVDMTRSIFQM